MTEIEITAWLVAVVILIVYAYKAGRRNGWIDKRFDEITGSEGRAEWQRAPWVNGRLDLEQECYLFYKNQHHNKRLPPTL